MKTIALDKIIIPPNRQRRHFDEGALIELADSLLRGMQHAIVLRNDNRTLVSGERRTRAVRILNSRGLTFPHDGELVPLGEIPYVTLGELDPLQLREAEFEENVCRLDLSWQERAAAKSELHQLRLEQSGGTQTLTATASEIAGEPVAGGSPIASLSDSILVAKYLDDPEVANAKSLKEAKKIVSSKLERLFADKLRSQLGDIRSDHKAIHGDAFDVMPSLEGFDCIIADPPYGLEAQRFGSQATTKHTYSDTAQIFRKIALEFPRLAYNVLKQRGHCYIFHDIRDFRLLHRTFGRAGFRVWPVPIIWNKGSSSGMLPDPHYGPRRTYEAILFAIKGDKPVISVGMPDVLDYPRVVDKDHAAQKPVDLYLDLLRRSCIAGDKVLDAFCGSGTLFPACTKHSCFGTGIELDQSNFNIATLRLNAKE